MSLLSKGLHFPWPLQRLTCQNFNNQIRNYAARKGTRERKQKKKVKTEEVKVGFIPHNIRDRDKIMMMRGVKKFDDSWKQTPTDNVYVQRYYKWTVYPFVEAVQCHRETHHPEVYNQPNAPLQILIELNMQGEKKTRFVDNFTRIAPMPHKFEHGEQRTILTFTKDLDMQRAATEAGATVVGGIELIKEVQNGNVALQDFQFFIAHPNILPELVSLRGLMKKKFPNPKSGTLDEDLVGVINKFITGITYTAKKDEYEKDFGTIDTTIGTINMDPKHLEENFVSLLKDVVDARPKREGHFISRCLVLSPPSREKLKVDHKLYVDDSHRPKTRKQNEADQEEVEAPQAVSA